MKHIILPLLCCAFLRAADAPKFPALVDAFFDEAWFAFRPSEATASGFHRYDPRLEDYSRASVDAEIAALRRFLPRFEKLHAPEAEADRELVIAKIRGRLLDLEEIRMWEKNPDLYSSGIASAAFVIMSRNYAPASDRLRSLIARERRMPAALDAARVNLRNPPRVYTEVALEQLPGIAAFFEKDVPAAFASVTDSALLAQFREANTQVLRALAAYREFLQRDLLPRSRGDFRIGADLYRRKLLYDEMVDTPLDALLEAGYANLRANQGNFARAAARIDPKRAPRDVLAQLEQDHPAPDRLLAAFRETLGGLRDFIVQRKIVDIPSPVAPILQETPPFLRALTLASMDIPGAYETVAKEAFFNVTLPEPGWTPQRVAGHMAAFNRGTIVSTATHEAYPGHYVQFLWVQRAPSKVRRLLGANSNAEGWAHYCEQMMLDEGYGNGDPHLRLGQLQDALLRNARYIAGIGMHTGRMSFDQAVDFFVKEGYQTRENALREVKRGTSDPTYLVYTLGKLEILRLREDYRKQQGAAFRLEEFHDRFLAQGFPPIKLVRQALLK